MRPSAFSKGSSVTFRGWGGEVLMTDWIFRSLLGSKIRPQRRGMEQSYFQSLDGMRLSFIGSVGIFFFFFEWKFLRVILEDSSIHSVEHLEIL